MKKRFAYALITTVALAALAYAPGVEAQAVPVSTCGPLAAFGATYRLTADLHACGGDCLVVASNRITIDLQGHRIVQDCVPVVPAASGITDAGIARDGTTVKNGTVSGFVFGVDLGASTRSGVLNVTASENDLDGIIIGLNSLAKGCAALDNGGDGIRAGNRVQVEQCQAKGNDGSGIHVGNECLVTVNLADDNLEDGIATGGRCGVTRNTVTNNADDGIDVGHSGEFDGSRSLVTANGARGNFDDGIRVQCPSTVTNNVSTANGLNYDLVGAGCVSTNNR